MGKTKDKKTLKGVSDAKHASQIDVDSCTLDSSRMVEALTCSLKKAKKKRKKLDLHAQASENKCSELQTESRQEKGSLKKKTVIEDIHSRVGPSDRVFQPDMDAASPHEEPPRKKKKKEKSGLTDENASRSSKKKVKKFPKEKGSVDPAEIEVDVTCTLEEGESNAKCKKKSEEQIRKKKSKDKHKDKEKINKLKSAVRTEHHTQTVLNEENLQIKLGEGEGDVELANPTMQIGTGYRAKRRIRGSTDEVDASLLEELKEFVPNVESREPRDIVKMIHYDLPRYKDFKKMGIPLRHGRFTEGENERLRKNVEDFMALTGINSATKLFFPSRFKNEKENIKKLRRLHRFFERIADGIPRSCHDIYARGTRYFDDKNHKGQFSEKEIHTLCKLQTLHGNNWKKISELTGRSALSLEKRFAQLSKAVLEGEWSKKEVQRLLQAVRDHIVRRVSREGTESRVSRETLYKNLPWQKIAAKVKTRCWTKCREKWMSVLAVKMSSGALKRGKKSYEVQIKLIKAMYEMQVDDVAYVNWDDLTTVIGDVPPAYVQRKWHKLKVCHVPHWQSKCFGDIVDFLYDNVLPHLENEMKDCGDEGETPLEENLQESFLLSHIFQDINEDIDDDEKDIYDRDKEA